MAPKRQLVIFCILICVNIIRSAISDNISNVSESYNDDILTVFSHLNSTPFEVYNYKQAALIYAHKKADITELAIDITVECNNKYPDVPCNEGVLTCHAFVQTNSEGVRQVLNDVNCKPKPEIIIEEVPPTTKPTEIENTVNDPKTIVLSNEAVSSEIGDHFVAVRRDSFPCLGCPFDLNPKVEGVDELIQTALKHIDSERSSKHTLIKVLKLQQQVVAGIKYILTAEIAPTICSKDTTSPLETCPVDNNSGSFTCRVTYLQQPWISRTKHVIGNNCTVSQEFDISSGKVNNEVGFTKKNSGVSPNFDHIAETGTVEEMSPLRLADLESQIIVERDDHFSQHQNAVKSENELSIPSVEPTKYEVDTFSAVNTDSTLGTSTTEQRVILNEFVSTFNCSNSGSNSNAKHEESPITTLSSLNSNTDSSEEGAREKRSDESVESSETNSTVSENSKQASNSSEESSEENKPREDQSVKIKAERVALSDTNTTASDLTQVTNSSENGTEGVTTRSKRDIFQLREKRSEESVESSESNSTESSEEVKPRGKRAIRQLEKISPEEKHLVMNLADFAANALDHIDDDNHKRLVLQILGAKKMVANDGVYYHLIMRMGVSLCLEDEPLNEECREKLFENYTKICKVQVFVNDDVLSPKLIKSQCQNIKKDKNNNSNRTNYGRFKRQEGKLKLQSKDADSYAVQDVAKSMIEHLNKDMKKTEKFRLIKIKSVKSGEFEDGTYYALKVKVSKGTERKMCTFKVIYASAISVTRYKVKCEDGEFYKFKVDGIRRKRQIPGAPSEITKDDVTVQGYLEDGLLLLDSESSHDNKLKPQEIISATRQVVAGLIYRIKVKVILSDCKKNNSSARTQCGTLQGSEPKICDFVIFDQAWKPNGRVTNVTCEGNESHSFRGKRDISSNVFVPRDPYQTAHELNLLDKWNMILSRAQPIHVDKNSKHMQAYFKEAIYHFNCKMGFPYKMKPVGLNSATKQAVAGQAYKIDGNVAESDCSKNSTKDLDLCRQVGDVQMSCTVKVLDRPWLRTRDYSVACGNHEVYVFDIYGEYPFKREFLKLKLKVKRDVREDESEELYLDMYKEFLRKYDKKYQRKDFNYRLKVFKDNIKYIRMLNTYEQGTAWYGITRFADLTRKEFSRSHGLRMDLRNENNSPLAQAQIPNITIPNEFDWRKKGVVSEVKNQEQCGSCWAFSVTGNIEGQYAIKHGKLLEFSEQELVDCDSEDQGCNGGLMDTAYRFIEKRGGLETEQDYPYDAEDEKCHFNKTLVRVELTGALNISHNETDMAKWLVASGPISIAINANAMQFYMGGVSHPFKFLCNPKSLDHGVLVVGYGVHSYPLFKRSLPYWIVKNSWGTDWGEQGYYRVYRGDGTCGLNQTPSSAIVA